MPSKASLNARSYWLSMAFVMLMWVINSFSCMRALERPARMYSGIFATRIRTVHSRSTGFIQTTVVYSGIISGTNSRRWSPGMVAHRPRSLMPSKTAYLCISDGAISYDFLLDLQPFLAGAVWSISRKLWMYRLLMVQNTKIYRRHVDCSPYPAMFVNQISL